MQQYQKQRRQLWTASLKSNRIDFSSFSDLTLWTLLCDAFHAHAFKWKRKSVKQSRARTIDRLNSNSNAMKWNECICTHHSKSIYTFYLFSTTTSTEIEKRGMLTAQTVGVSVPLVLRTCYVWHSLLCAFILLLYEFFFHRFSLHCRPYLIRMFFPRFFSSSNSFLFCQLLMEFITKLTWKCACNISLHYVFSI